MKYSLMKNSQGFTLLEVLITLVILTILGMVGVPSYNTFMANERFAAATNDLNNAYRFARNEAIKTSTSMTLEATSVDDVWANGWQVTHYSGASPTVLFVSKEPHSSVEISGAAVTVRGRGSLSGGSNVSFTITGANKTRRLCIFSSGQSVKQDEDCP